MVQVGQVLPSLCKVEVQLPPVPLPLPPWQQMSKAYSRSHVVTDLNKYTYIS